MTGIAALICKRSVSNQQILDRVLAVLPSKDRLIVITLPDFSQTPAGQEVSKTRNISEGLKEFNAVITTEAKARNLSVIDIFDISKKIGLDPQLVCDDGLHPSSQGHLLWASLIFPEAQRLLQSSPQ